MLSSGRESIDDRGERDGVIAPHRNILIASGEPSSGAYIVGVLGRLARDIEYDVVIAGGGGLWPAIRLATHEDAKKTSRAEPIGAVIGALKKPWISEDMDFITERLFAWNPPWYNWDRFQTLIIGDVSESMVTKLAADSRRSQLMAWYVPLDPSRDGSDLVPPVMVNNYTSRQTLKDAIFAHNIVPEYGIPVGYDPLTLPPIPPHPTGLVSIDHVDVVTLTHTIDASQHQLARVLRSRRTLLGAYCASLASFRLFDASTSHHPIDFSSAARTDLLQLGQDTAHKVLGGSVYNPNAIHSLS